MTSFAKDSNPFVSKTFERRLAHDFGEIRERALKGHLTVLVKEVGHQITVTALRNVGHCPVWPGDFLMLIADGLIAKIAFGELTTGRHVRDAAF